MIDLVIASHNQGKALDLARLFEGSPTGLGFASELGIPDVEETGKSFEENAILKAVHANSRLAYPALGDDSGLCIPSWNNKPGIHTKRFAMSKGGWSEGILALKPFAMQGVPARLYCALAIAWSSTEVISVLGHVDGHLAWPPRGRHGFGFDPIFCLEPNGTRFAELPTVEREKINHRNHAFQLLKEHVNINIDGRLVRTISANNLHRKCHGKIKLKA